MSLATEKMIHDQTEGVYVNFVVILAQIELKRQVEQAAYLIIERVVVGVFDGAQVAYFGDVALVEEYIFGLYVSVDEIFIVNVSQTAGDIAHDVQLGEPGDLHETLFLIGHKIFECAVVHVLHDEKQI